MNRRPTPQEFAPYYGRYVEHVPDGDVVATLVRQGESLGALLDGLPEARGDHRYAPGKWTIREVTGHIMDTERVMAYRALRFARGDATPLASFDESTWAASGEHGTRTLGSLVAEFRAVRAATIALLSNLSPAAWDRTGVASGYEVSVRGLAWIIAGHALHHQEILKTRYLGAGVETPAV